MRKLHGKLWIEKVKNFQSLSKEERNDWCSYCGCEGGCNLCTDISNIKEEDVVNDDTL